MNLYNRIDELRKKKGITWKHINEKVDGTYRGRMTEFKNGKTSFSHEQLETIAKILDTSTDYLLGRTDDPRPIGESHDVSSFPSLNGEVGELVDIFNSLTQEGKTMLLGVARSLLSNPAYSLNRVEEKMAE